MDVKTAADKLNVGPRTVRRWIKTGRLKADFIAAARVDGRTIPGHWDVQPASVIAAAEEENECQTTQTAQEPTPEATAEPTPGQESAAQEAQTTAMTDGQLRQKETSTSRIASPILWIALALTMILIIYRALRPEPTQLPEDYFYGEV